jgi:hypothetical protein
VVGRKSIEVTLLEGVVLHVNKTIINDEAKNMDNLFCYGCCIGAKGFKFPMICYVYIVTLVGVHMA